LGPKSTARPQTGDPFGGLEVTHIDKLKGGQMRIIYLVPIIFVALLAAVSSTTRSGLAEPAAQGAADECVSKPGATAPQGSHWYYRVNRADSRHCWYLGPEGARMRAREAATPTRTSSPRPIRQRSAARLADATAAQTAPAEAVPAQAKPVEAARVEAAPAEATAGENAAAAEFATRWPDLPSSLDLNARKPATMSRNSFAEEHATTDAQDGMPLVWPVLTPAELAAAEPAAQSNLKWVYILAVLSGTLALAAMLLNAINNRAAEHQPVRSDLRDQRRAASDMPRPRMKMRPQFADALAAARRADSIGDPLAAARKVDLVRRPLMPNEEPSEAPREAPSARPRERPSERASERPSEPPHDVEEGLRRLLHAWQRVAA
jgi:hypothetical protein